jgi:hypothetical protein
MEFLSMHRLAIAFLLCLAAAPAHAADRKFDPDAAAKAVAPYLDDRTVAVVHVDLTRVNVDAFAEKFAALTKMKLDDLAQEKKAAASLLDTLKKAGAKDAFLVVSLIDIPNNPPFVVLPQDKDGDPKAILDLTPKQGLHSYGPYAEFRYEQIGEAVVGGGEATRTRLKSLKPTARPEVMKAFTAAGDGVAQAALFATLDTRKIFEDTLPNLPPELGGGSIKPLTRGLQWVSIRMDAPPKLSLHFIYQMNDKESAEQLHTLLVKTAKFAGEQKDLQEIPNFAKLVETFLPKIDGDRLTLTVDDATLTAVLAPLFVKVHQSWDDTKAANDMKQLGIALHNYHSAMGRFPAVASFDKQSKPLLSWRVHLLPYLGEEKLYKEFKLDEPWDSEHNKKLIAKMPKAFVNPANPKLAADGKTTYVAPVHTTAIFTGDMQGTRIVDITDGTSNTILLVDVDDADAVIWTKPHDLKLDPKNPAKGLSTRHDDRYMLLLADGSVEFIEKKIDKEALNAFFTKAGGEVVKRP